jgi:hypothetical protein
VIPRSRVVECTATDPSSTKPSSSAGGSWIRLPAGSVVFEGDEVIVSDGEGTECVARIDEVQDNGRGMFVLLAPVPGSFRRNAPHRSALAG